MMVCRKALGFVARASWRPPASMMKSPLIACSRYTRWVTSPITISARSRHDERSSTATVRSPCMTAKSHEYHRFGTMVIAMAPIIDGPAPVSGLRARGVAVPERRGPEAPFELPIKVLLAPIADEQRHRLDFHALADQGRGAVETHGRQPLVHRHPDHSPEHAPEVRALTMKLGRERPQGDWLGVRLLDAIQHSSHVFLRRRHVRAPGRLR